MKEPLPPILISAADHDKLSRYAETRAMAMPEVSTFLEQELDRATVVAPHEVPRGVVTMNSRLLFRVDGSRISRAATLVHPEDTDVKSGRLSILTPIGVALLGLAESQTMPWQDQTGETKTLIVQCVLSQPSTERRYS